MKSAANPSKTIGVISSTAGSCIFEVLPFLKEHGYEIVVATDRSCPVEQKCAIAGVTYQRFSYQDKDSFSAATRTYFQKQSVELVLLYFTRLVGAQLFAHLATYNVHRSLLPVFPGLNSLKQHIEAGVHIVGTTAHEVNDTIDGGRILCQVANHFTPETIIPITFLQGVYVTLALLDKHIYGQSYPAYLNASLGLSPNAEAYFRDLEKKHQRQILA